LALLGREKAGRRAAGLRAARAAVGDAGRGATYLDPVFIGFWLVIGAMQVDSPVSL
jgi:hypothetical protein